MLGKSVKHMYIYISLGILAKLRLVMEPKYLSFRFGYYTPQSSSDKVTGYLGSIYIYIYIYNIIPNGGLMVILSNQIQADENESKNWICYLSPGSTCFLKWVGKIVFKQSWTSLQAWVRSWSQSPIQIHLHLMVKPCCDSWFNTLFMDLTPSPFSMCKTHQKQEDKLPSSTD